MEHIPITIHYTGLITVNACQCFKGMVDGGIKKSGAHHSAIYLAYPYMHLPDSTIGHVSLGRRGVSRGERGYTKQHKKHYTFDRF